MLSRARRLFAVSPEVAARWARDPTARAAYQVATWSSLLTATLLIVGGADRLSAPAFATIRATGGVPVWAPLWALTGLTLAWATRAGLRACHNALTACAAFYALAGAGFAWSAVLSPGASWFGATAHGTVALLLLVCAAAHRTPGGGR